MMRLTSAALTGLDARPIDVEVDATPGLHVFRIVGLPDKAVAESRERITAAIKNSGATPPGGHNKRITVNLAPADIKKEGPAYDLPIALGFLAATEQLRFNPDGKLFAGEVALDGSIRPVRGVLAIARMASDIGIAELYVPHENAAEAAVVDDITVMPVTTLSELIAHLEGRSDIAASQSTPTAALESDEAFDLRHVRGQSFAKRALAVAAAGGHNVLLVGPPGSGKTLLARAMTTILPPLTPDEMLEVSTIYSIAGLLNTDTPLKRRRPFRSPHHTASAASVIGGGQHPKPGEVTFAHRGVLFLDELPEFRRDVLEALRQPLEDNVVTITRARGHVTFPASFTLVGAMNPCPCGFRGDEQKACTCTAGERARYERKLSGPLLDRIDLHVTVPRVSHATLTGADAADTPITSVAMRSHVTDTRVRQRNRFQTAAPQTNAEMTIQHIKRYCAPDDDGEALLRKQMNEHDLSARGYHRTLKVARTIADLEESDAIRSDHIFEALQYRRPDALFA